MQAGRLQRDVQQAAVALTTEVPYATASTLFGQLTGMSVSSERMHTVTHQVAAGLSAAEVAPSRAEIDRLVAQVAAGRFRRPVLVLGIDGAYVPSRPESARERRPGQARHRARRARWRHEWREATGGRFSVLAGERMVHGRSWHQGYTEEDMGEAVQQVQDAGVSPEEAVRLCGVCDGAAWSWQHVPALFPPACQGLDYAHCAASLHTVARAQDGQTVQALEGVEAPVTRWSMGKMGSVLGGLRRRQPPSNDACKGIANCWGYLNAHRGRTASGRVRRGGSPLGSGGMESAHKCRCPVRLKRSGAWWYEAKSNQLLALRCTKDNGTFAQVCTRSQHQKADA